MNSYGDSYEGFEFQLATALSNNNNKNSIKQTL